MIIGIPWQVGDRVYFMGLIMGTPITIGGTEDFIVCSVQIEIDSVSAVLQENAPA